MKRIFCHSPDSTACGYYRAWLPYKHCKEPLQKEGTELVFDTRLRSDEPFDAYIFHRIITERFLPQLQKLKGRIVWELDDYLWDVPHNRELVAPEQLKRLERCLDIADTILVSTPRLKEEMGGWRDKTLVAPNLIDLEPWPTVEPPRDTQQLRVVFAGSDTHWQDLNMIAQQFIEVTMRLGEKVRFTFFGCEPELRIPGAEYLPFGLNYIQTLCSLRPHVGIAPLVPNRFNACKSNIKYLEYTAAGAVTIASELDPFRECRCQRAFPDEWWKALVNVSFDQIVQAQEDVRKNWSWQEKREVWLDIFRRL